MFVRDEPCDHMFILDEVALLDSGSRCASAVAVKRSLCGGNLG